MQGKPQDKATYRIVDGRTLDPPVNASVYIVTDRFGHDLPKSVTPDAVVARRICKNLDKVAAVYRGLIYRN
jgi:hypothetical protein